MDLSSRAEVLDLKHITKFTYNASPNFIRKLEDKGKKYSFYELLSRKNSRTGTTAFFPQETDELDSKDKTLGIFGRSSPTRLLCIAFHEGPIQKLITALMISLVSFIFLFADLKTLASRPTAFLHFERPAVLGVLYASHGWFLARCLISRLS